MLSKLLSKTVLLGGAGGTIYLSNSIDISNNLPTKKFNLQSTSLAKTISNLEDIELYEKFHNCNFVFIDNWSNGTMYKYEEFLNKHKTDKWKQDVIKGAERFKDKCKEKKVVTLAFSGNKFEIKV